LNRAIDSYNSVNPAGATVGHVTSYLDGANKIVLTSSTKGTDSQVTVTAVSAATSVAALDLSQTAGAKSAAANTGTNTYNSTAVAGATLVDFQINGVKLEASSAAIAVGDNMTTTASGLQTNLNTAISAYNTAAGLTSGMNGYIQAVKVEASKDGRLVVSDESGAVTFNERAGATTISDLGLTQAQTESAGNGGMTFQIGSNRGQTMQFGISDMRTAALSLSGVDVSTAAGASLAITSIDKAITSVSDERSKLGAVQNRLEHTVSNLGTSSENLTAAESRIRDVDMAKEMTEFTKNNILSQAAQAMLAQANQQPQGVLQLLR
jgi:flagellin